MMGRVAATVAALWLAASTALAAPTIEDFSRLPAIEMAAISPSGSRYALVETVNDIRRIRVLDLSDKILLEVGVPSEMKVRDLDWAGDDILLMDQTRTYNLSDNFQRDRAEITQTTAIHVADGKLVRIFDSGPAKGAGVYGYYGSFQEDGAWYGYFKGLTLTEPRENPYDLYRVDLTSGKTERVERSPGGKTAMGWLVNPTGEVAARAQTNTQNGKWTLSVGNSQVYEASNGDFSHTLVALGRTPGSVIVRRREAERYSTYEWRPGASEPERLIPDLDFRSIVFDGNNRRIVGFRLNAPTPTYVFLQPEHQARYRAAIRPFGELRTRPDSWSEDFSKVILYVEGDTEAGGYYIVDVPGRSARRIGDTYPNVPPEAVAPTRLVSYRASDGLEMEGVLTTPPGVSEPKNLPLVMIPHNGPRSYDVLAFNWQAQAFANRGYAVFQPNYRGSVGYTNALEKAGEGEWGNKILSDVADGLAHLAAQGVVDPTRACILGGGFGGYIAAASVTVRQGGYRCSVAIGGIFDLKALLNETTRDRSAVEARYLRTQMGADKVDIEAISPANLAGSANAPILLIHGKDDTSVSIWQSRAMADRLRAQKKPFEYVSLKDEDHWLSRSETRAAMLKASVAFVEKHNPAK